MLECKIMPLTFVDGLHAKNRADKNCLLNNYKSRYIGVMAIHIPSKTESSSSEEEAAAEQAFQIARQFAALGHPVRVFILRALICAGGAGSTVSQLREALGVQHGCPVPATTFTHHLKILADAQLINQHRSGRELYSAPRFETLRELMSFLMRECCADEHFDAHEFANTVINQSKQLSC